MECSEPASVKAPTAPLHPRKLNQVAVCFAGNHRATILARGAHLRAQVIEPLGADVLLSLSVDHHDTCSDLESCRVLERLRCLQPIERAKLAPAMTTAALVQTLEALPHWNRVLQAFSGGDWIDVPPQGPDVLVCNLGECAQMASAGYLLATPHRVLAARGERVSVPFFYNPALSATVRPLELPASLPWEREEDAGEV